MTVTTTPNTEYLGKELQMIFYKGSAIKQLARELTVSQAEGVIEMLCDGYDDQIENHADVKRAVDGIKDCTKEMLNDLIGDLHRELNTYIDELNIKLVRSAFDDRGLNDAEVLIEYPHN